MASFPSAAAIQPPVTVGSQKTNFAAWLAACKQLLGASAPQSKTIASGVITPDGGASFWIHADTQSAAASDDLDRVALDNVPAGSLLRIQAADTNRTVVVKNGSGGSGQILTVNAGDFSLDDDEKFIDCKLVGTSWVEVDRGWGADVSAFRAFLGLGTAAIVNTGTSSSNLPTNAQIFDTARDYTRQQRFTEATLTDAATISWNGDTQQFAKVTLGATRTLGNISNLKAGSVYQLRVITGGFNLNYGSAYRWPGGSAPDLTTGAGWVLSFTPHGSLIWGAAVGPFATS